MEQPTTIGIDLAKNVFQLHGVDASGGAILKRKLRRGQVLEFFARRDPCFVGMEVCAGAHFWARELMAPGHEVRIMPPSYVKPYVKCGKTDQADAEAICEAVTRPTMRFVPVKSAKRQAALLDHKTRDFLVRQRTQLVNTIRAHLSEFGIIAAKGIHNIERLLEAAKDLPAAARPAVDMLAKQLRETQDKIDDLTARIESAQKADPLARRLATIPGIGAVTASAIAATTPEVDNFRSGRDYYAAWLGLTPQPHSSGGKERLGKEP
jgi:transposase